MTLVHIPHNLAPSSNVALQQLTISFLEAGQRIDNFLIKRLKGVPKSRLYKALRKGEVRVNKKRIQAEYRLQAGDIIRVPPVRLPVRSEPRALAKNTIQLIEESVLFENNTFLVINKPSGMAAHGGSGIQFGVIEAFRQLRPKLKFLELAHRLDKDTTGCMLLVKKPSVLKEVHTIFKSGAIKKTYLALVAGTWDGGRRVVDLPLNKNTLVSGERFVKPHPDGKSAKTIFEPLQCFAKATLVKASPLTGRTHQIRVHSAYLGHPILGDVKYGYTGSMPGLRVKHLLLHAASLEFELLGQVFAFSACCDDEFNRVLDLLQKPVSSACS